MVGRARGPAVAVVGGGVGGLACAIDLAASGHAVTVLERSSIVGGKMRTLDVAGLAVDAGPTVLTMRAVFDELFQLAGKRLEDYVTLARAEVLARHAWPDGARLDLFADHERSVDAIAQLSGVAEARRYRAFCAYARRIFETVEGPFVHSPRPTFAQMLKYAATNGPGVLGRIDAHRTMARALEAHFQDPRLRQLFGRYATYCGSSPFEAPATLNLIAHVEAAGVYRVVGGMRQIAASLERLGRELGVVFRTDADVARVVVRDGRAVGVELCTGERVKADAVVSNADAEATLGGLLGDDRRARSSDGVRSLSAVTWAVVGRVEGFPLVHHNVFFSLDYQAEFDALCRGKRMPAAPTTYVCAQDRGDDDGAAGAERLLIIVNAPPTGDDPSAWPEEERQRCETSAFSVMERCGLRLAPRASIQTTPVEFHRQFPATGGALYGPAARGPFSSLSRRGSRTKISGLYLAGGSVHPGPGVPMAALSGRLAAECVRQDLASTARSRPADIRGAISTA
jgi:1-hydroxycarotenoid 3,4-desaturase